jgi:hypothetical protein
MSENTFPQAQHMKSFFEKAAKDNAATFEAMVDASVAMTKASLDYAAQVSEQWGKLATETSRRMTKPAS